MERMINEGGAITLPSLRRLRPLDAPDVGRSMRALGRADEIKLPCLVAVLICTLLPQACVSSEPFGGAARSSDDKRFDRLVAPSWPVGVAVSGASFDPIISQKGNGYVVDWPSLSLAVSRYDLLPLLYNVDNAHPIPLFLEKEVYPLGEPEGGDFPDRRVVRALDEAEPVTVKLAWTGVAYGPFPRLEGSDDFRIQGSFFDASGKPIEADILTETLGRPVPGLLEFNGYLPRLAVQMKVDSQQEWIPLALHLYDSRTKNSLIASGSHSLDFGLDWMGANFNLGMWHPAPVTFLIDLAHGPIQTQDIEPRIGEAFRLRKATLRLISHWDGQYHVNIQDSRIFLHIKNMKQKSSFMFACDLPGALLPYRLLFLDAQGLPIPANRELNNRLVFYNVDAQRETIKTIRLTYYPDVRRFVLPLDEVPGLPQVNKGQLNLFQVRIPHLWVADQGDLGQVIRAATQMELHYKDTSTMVSTFKGPLKRKDVTPANLLQLYLDSFPGYRMRVDAKEERIVFYKAKTLPWFLRQNP